MVALLRRAPHVRVVRNYTGNRDKEEQGMAVDRNNTRTTREYAQPTSIGRSLLYGAAAGIASGIVFGLMMMMVMPGMMPMIGRIVGMENLAGGWLYHLFNSAVIGGIFGLAVSVLRASLSYGTGALWGAVYGMIWWVLGPLVLMPLLLGMPEMMFNINTDSLMSLMGHVIFGVITGLGYVFLRDRFRG